MVEGGGDFSVRPVGCAYDLMMPIALNLLRLSMSGLISASDEIALAYLRHKRVIIENDVKITFHHLPSLCHRNSFMR